MVNCPTHRDGLLFHLLKNGSRHFTNISSCVLNNGFSTAPFKIQRGVRQVHPLSSCLFIMVLEILTINIRSNKNIQGITVDGEEIKLEIFADDLTAFLLKCPCDQIFEFHFFTFSCPIRLSYSPCQISIHYEHQKSFCFNI